MHEFFCFEDMSLNSQHFSEQPALAFRICRAFCSRLVSDFRVAQERCRLSVLVPERREARRFGFRRPAGPALHLLHVRQGAGA